MRNEDLKTFSRMGNAFWEDRGTAQRNTMETLSAVSLLDLNPERSLERTVSALLDRAVRDAPAGLTLANLGRIHHPFFRLSAVEKLLLVALHCGRWSYARLARILSVTPEWVEETAWNARLQLAPAQTYPAGPAHPGPSCPEYHPRRPWTQRLLDEEMRGSGERVFMQTHLMACDSCQQSLNRCRDLYFKLEGMLAERVGQSDFTAQLEEVLREGKPLRSVTDWTVGESLRVFVRRWDVQVALGLGLLLLFMKLSQL